MKIRPLPIFILQTMEMFIKAYYIKKEKNVKMRAEKLNLLYVLIGLWLQLQMFLNIFDHSILIAASSSSGH